MVTMWCNKVILIYHIFHKVFIISQKCVLLVSNAAFVSNADVFVVDYDNDLIYSLRHKNVVESLCTGKILSIYYIKSPLSGS